MATAGLRIYVPGLLRCVFYYTSIDGLWLTNESGAPVYHDFTSFWIAGWQVLHGETASIYDLPEFKAVQARLVGIGYSPYSLLAYPPTFTLALASLSMLPYVAALLTWEALTLVCYTAVIYLIVRRQPAISLALASPFAAWNFLIGQNGFMTASLIGAALVLLERRPVLAGVFIGCLTYKPQFGVLFPVAFIATS